MATSLLLDAHEFSLHGGSCSSNVINYLENENVSGDCTNSNMAETMELERNSLSTLEFLDGKVIDKLEEDLCRPHCGGKVESINSISNYEHLEVNLDKGKVEDHVCSNCGQTFSSLNLLERHVKSYHSNAISVTESFENSVDIKCIIKKKRECKWICEICKKAFRSSRALQEHEVVHTGARDFPCTVCGKAFGTAANMRIHLATHSDQRPFICQTCGASFRQKDSLKVHVRKHTGERPFVCNICKMAFDRSFTLKNHMLTHGAKSFVCSFCGKAFSTRGGLNNHERLHYKDPHMKTKRGPRAKSGSGNWVCDECGKIYSTRSNLKLHQKSHEPTQTSHVCPVCSQSYKSRDSMEVHMRRHTEDRPYKCTICSRSFYRNYTLKIHILTHTGEKPHLCPVDGCKKSFAQTSSLSYHIRNHKKREENNLNGSGKRPYRKRKIGLSNDVGLEINNDVNKIGPECVVAQDLKLNVGTLLHQDIPGVVDPTVQSMFDGVPNDMVDHMDHALSSVWTHSGNENTPVLRTAGDFHHNVPHSSGHDHTVDIGLHQQHCQQTSFLPYVSSETLPYLVGLP